MEVNMQAQCGPSSFTPSSVETRQVDGSSSAQLGELGGQEATGQRRLRESSHGGQEHCTAVRFYVPCAWQGWRCGDEEFTQFLPQGTQGLASE